VAETGVRNHQRLHGQGIAFHEKGDTRVGVEHDFVRERIGARLVLAALDQKMFAEAPMPVIHRETARDIAVEHLFAGDDFHLVGEGVESVTLGVPGTDLLDGQEVVHRPFAAAECARLSHGTVQPMAYATGCSF
jgi:hypothetical protein